MTVLQTAGLSHSEIPGSKVICTSPGLVAAYHVLHRLREPRHPPYALSYFLLREDRLHSAYSKQASILLSFALSFFACINVYLSLRKGIHDTSPYFQLYWNFLFYSFVCNNMSKIVLSSVESRVWSVELRILSTRTMVENNGFEPLTPCLQSRCSSQLS